MAPRASLIGRTLILLIGPAAPTLAQNSPTRDCASLAALELPYATISAVERVTAGSFAVPGFPTTIRGLPPFCRIMAVISPTLKSHIGIEVWLPLENWSGKFVGVGNGGWAGFASYDALGRQIRRGNAAASTDTGHEGTFGVDMARFAFEFPERLVDFAHRSHHETAVKGKAITEAFYGRPADYSYFVGCSSGGYEGLMEAQRYPEDYDGIAAEAPANNWTRLMAGIFDATLAALVDPESVLSPTVLSVLHRGVLEACDAVDGVTDGVLEDPRRCDFDPASLACPSGEMGENCLTTAQVRAARQVYRGLIDPVTGASLYPGLAPGSEPFWPHRNPAFPFAIPVSHYKWLVFSDSTWDWRSFSFSDPEDREAHLRAEAKYGPILNATDPDLREFQQRGGKLLQHHGWSDGLIAPQNSIDYYESVLTLFGAGRSRVDALAEVQSFYRLYMVPGVGHCGGGRGTDTYDMQEALEQWVEKEVVPNRVVATRQLAGVVDRARPLCPYPAVAEYRQGNTNQADSFVCRVLQQP